MPSPSLIPPLNVIAGLVDDASRAAPVPPLEVAAAQLRAINHRLLHGVLDPHGTASGSGLFQDRGAALADFAKPCFATSIASFPAGKVNIRRFAAHITVHKAVHKAPAI